MRKVLTKLSLLVVMLAMFIPEITKASHNTGGDISYTYLGIPNTYLLRYRFYRDQTGIGAPAQINLCYQSATTGLSGTALLLPIAGTGGLIPPSPCVPPGSGYLIEEYIYEGTVVVPAAAVDWIFSFSECCRNAGICNIQAGSLYVYATMDNLNYPTNSSPAFTTIPVTEFCVNNPFYWSQQAVDIDGDSLVYSVISALDGNGGCPNNSFPATYIAPFTPTDPLPTLNGFNMNTNTGVIYFTPTVQCSYVIAVLCEEFNPITGLKKSEINRDMQINVSAACNIIPPAFDSIFQLNGVSIIVDGLTSFCDDTIIYLALNPPIQCGSITTTDIRFVDANGVPNPIVAAIPYSAIPSQACVNGLTDTIQVTLLNPIQIGTSYVFTKIGFDGNTFLSECGSSMPEFDSIAITLVDSSSYLFNANDTVGCSFTNLVLNTNQNVDCYTLTTTGSEFTLIDANGLNIPITALNCSGQYSNTFNFTVNPPAGVVSPLYLITQNGTDGNTFTNACGTAVPANDTIAIIIILNYLPINAGPDQTVCSSQPAPVLNAGTFSTAAVYSWTGPNGFSASTQIITANQTGQYIVTVTDGAACQGSDTVDITIVSAPTVALGTDIQLCTGDPIPFLNAGNTGATYQWYYNTLLMAGQTNQLLFPDSAGIYVVSVDLGGGCIGYDTISITINSVLVINLGGNQTICSNDPLPILDAGVAGATYVWTGPGVTASDTLQTLAITQAGTYSVVVTNPTGCSGSGSYTLTIVQAPSVSLGFDQTYCAGQAVTPLDAQNPGASYIWTGPGTTAADTLQFYTPTQTGTFTVNVNNGGICNATGSVNITIVTSLTVSVNNAAYCQGTAIPTLQATTGVSGIHYGWTGPGTTAADTLSSYTPTGPGTYNVTISIGTCSGTAAAIVTEVPTPNPSLSNLSACAGDFIPDLNCQYAPIAGTTYTWTGTGTSNGQTFTPTVSSGINNYSVTVTNTAAGITCSSTTVSMVYTVTPVPVVAPMTSSAKCGSPNSNTILDAGNTANATYQWSLNGTVITNATSQTYTVGNDGGVYSVVVADITNSSCKGTGSATITINPNPEPSIRDEKEEATEVFFCPTAPPVLLSGIDGTGNSWAWTLNGNPITNSNTTSITAQAAGNYSVTVTDANGCTGTDDIIVTEEGCEVVIPNVFTPNGDDKNQVFEITNLLDFKTRKLTIYDRWGKEIYSNDNYDNKWNGDGASAGTYFYVLEYANETISKTANGIVTIIK